MVRPPCSARSQPRRLSGLPPHSKKPCRSAPPKAVSALRFATALHKACGSKGRLQQCSANQGLCKSSPVAPLRPKRCRRYALPPHSTRPAVRRGGCSNVQRVKAFASRALSLRSAQSGVGASLCHRTPQGLRFEGAVAAMFSESGRLQVEPCRSAPPKAVSALRSATALHKACGSRLPHNRTRAQSGVRVGSFFRHSTLVFRHSAPGGVTTIFNESGDGWEASSTAAGVWAKGN